MTKVKCPYISLSEYLSLLLRTNPIVTKSLISFMDHIPNTNKHLADIYRPLQHISLQYNSFTFILILLHLHISFSGTFRLDSIRYPWIIPYKCMYRLLIYLSALTPTHILST